MAARLVLGKRHNRRSSFERRQPDYSDLPGASRTGQDMHEEVRDFRGLSALLMDTKVDRCPVNIFNRDPQVLLV